MTNFQNSFTDNTLWTLCNNVIIIYPTTSYMRLYTTLWNMNQICMYNNNNHFGKIENTLQINITVNDLCV